MSVSREESRKPLANGLLSIFSLVIWEKTSETGRSDQFSYFLLFCCFFVSLLLFFLIGHASSCRFSAMLPQKHKAELGLNIYMSWILNIGKKNTKNCFQGCQNIPFICYFLCISLFKACITQQYTAPQKCRSQNLNKLLVSWAWKRQRQPSDSVPSNKKKIKAEDIKVTQNFVTYETTPSSQ